MRPVFRFFLIFFTSLVILIGALFAVAGWYLQSSNFPELIEEHLTSLTGYEWSIDGPLDLSLVPLAIDVKDVSVTDPESGKKFLSVGKIQSGVALRPLFSKQVRIDRIRLDKVVVVISDELLASFKDDGNGAVKGTEQVDSLQLPMGDVAAVLNLKGVDISKGRIVWEQGSGDTREHVTANDINLKIDIGSESAFTLACGIESNFVPLKGKFSTSGRTVVDIANLAVKSLAGTVKWDGEVELEGRTLPNALAVQYTADFAKKILKFTKVNADIVDESLVFTGKMTRFDSSDWKLTGKAEVKHLSLPFWFGFTENIPTSLNHALDDINGILSIEMDKNGLQAPEINATVLGMKLSGRGAVADFSDPVIFIDARGKYIDVNKIFPEVGLNPPKVLPRPKLDKPPVFRFEDEPENLTPEERKKREAEEFSVGYDINVAADKATANGFKINDLSFRCWAAPETGTYTSYDIGGAYGGSINALLTIRDDLRLEATIKNVESEEPSRIITGDSVIAGVVNGTVDLRSDARTVFGLVAGLGGTVDAVIKNGYIKTLPQKMPDGSMKSRKNHFKDFSLKLNCKSLTEEPDKAGNDLPYNWDLVFTFASKDKDSKYTTALKGPVLVSAKRALPVRAEDLDFDIKWQGTMAVKDRKITAPWRLKSKLTYDLETEDAVIKDGIFTYDEQTIGLNLTAKKFVSDAEFRGSFDGEKINLQSLLRTLGLMAWETKNPEAFTNLKLKGEVDLRDGRYALYNVDGHIDDSELQGSVLVNFNSEVPTIRADVKLGSVVLDGYFPPENVDVQAKVFTKNPWDLEWLNNFDIKGSLNVSTLKYKTIEIQDIMSQVTIGNGEIQVGPLEARLYNGTLSGEFFGVRESKLESRLVANINGVDMALASKGAVGEDYLGGKATAYLEGQGSLGSNFEILSSVRGIWGFAIKDGFFGFEKDKQGNIEKTTFVSAVSDGSLGDGVMKSDNFAVKSPYVDMHGGGEINLVEKEIDYKVSVTFARIPTVPVAITGKWDDPDVTVDGLSVVPRTIGKLGGGVFSILKDAFLIPFRAIDLLPSAK